MANTESDVIRTERLLLRPFTMDDVDDVNLYTNDAEWARYQVNIPSQPYSRADSEELVSMFSDRKIQQQIGVARIFAITLDGRVIGEVGLNQKEEDRKNDRLEIVYSLCRDHWNRGLMTEAATAARDWAFRTFDFDRFYGYCDARNIASRRVLEKLGMTAEGTLRRHVKWQGEYRDMAYFGLLRHEWQAITGT